MVCLFCSGDQDGAKPVGRPDDRLDDRPDDGRPDDRARCFGHRTRINSFKVTDDQARMQVCVSVFPVAELK